MPLACADRISTRLRPYVKPPAGGRAANRIATSASAMAIASVSMCAASVISASEPAANPTITSAAMKARIRASAPLSSLRSALVLTAWPCP
jgi:hypothetical protein